MFYYFDWTYLLVVVGLVISLLAQGMVKSAYNRYSRVPTKSGMTAAQAAADMLTRNNNGGVRVERVSGQLTDNYDPKTETLHLSDGVFSSGSVAALGIAAHECGHAMQKMEDYKPLQLRTYIVPVVNIGSNLAWPIFLLGLIFSFKWLTTAGIVLFSLVVLFTLVTLPVEFDASRRAIKMLTSGGYVTADEERGVRTVLTAAAMTYVASALSAILQLLRLVLISNNRRRD